MTLFSAFVLSCNLIIPIQFNPIHSSKLNQMHRREIVVSKRQHQVNQIRSNHPAPTISSSKSSIHWIQLKVPTQTVNRRSQTNGVETMEHFWLVIRPSHCTFTKYIHSDVIAFNPHIRLITSIHRI